MIFEKGQKLLMIGDSITDTNRARPVGEGSGRAEEMGKGYVAMVDALLGCAYPQLGVSVVNMGISGNTVRDLKARWQTDVLDLRPDWVSIMIGVNDVWRQYDSPRQKNRHVYLPEFTATLEELLAATQPHVRGVILMTPFFLEPNRRDAMRATLDEYGQAIRQIAQRHGALLADVQAAFDSLLEHYYPATLSWDRVHPTATGHMLIARTFLNAVGFRW
jgi:lysophospholipase L1-like esterase